MAITLTDSRLGTTGILGGMQLGPLGGAGGGAAGIRQTQAVLEFASPTPAAAVRETQAALEHVGFPPNAIWQTQACLEVLFPADGFGPTGLRNYAYTGGWART